MSWVIDTITLPRNPKTASMKYTTVTKTIPMPGTEALVVAMGRQPQVLTIDGLISEAGKTLANLETDYLIPLKNKVGTVVTISAPDSRYDGDWLMNAFTYQEVGGNIKAFKFHIEFYRGSEHIVL